MKNSVTMSIILVLAFIAASTTMAGNVPTPAEPPEGVKIISTDEAKSLIEQKKLNVFDMRKALNFGKGHIPGATSLPYKWTKKGHPSERTGTFDISKLPSDKNTVILFHSDGPNGWKSYYASRAAAEAGYRNVMWMREGFAIWKDKGYTIEH